MLTAKQIGKNIFAKAVWHEGEKEDLDANGNGANWSDRIKIYLAYVGLTDPAAWCAAFASWVTGQVLDEMGLSDLAHVCTGSSHEAVNWARTHDTAQTASSCVTGDWLIERGGDGEQASDGYSYHHCTILDYVDENGCCFWIGGNTGDRVARGTCDISQCCILRPYVLQ